MMKLFYRANTFSGILLSENMPQDREGENIIVPVTEGEVHPLILDLGTPIKKASPVPVHPGFNPAIVASLQPVRTDKFKPMQQSYLTDSNGAAIQFKTLSLLSLLHGKKLL